MVPIDLVDASPQVCSSGAMTLQIFMRSDPINSVSHFGAADAERSYH
jgi:hypothetical protein